MGADQRAVVDPQVVKQALQGIHQHLPLLTTMGGGGAGSKQTQRGQANAARDHGTADQHRGPCPGGSDHMSPQAADALDRAARGRRHGQQVLLQGVTVVPATAKEDDDHGAHRAH